MNDIKWKVESVNIDRPDATSLPALDVSLIGVVSNYGRYAARRANDLVNEIESRLNITGSRVNPMEIKNVIFNPPATIVFWADGTKTVVQAREGDEFDPEKGLAMAISKKTLGNQGNYYNHFKKWTEKYECPEYAGGVTVDEFIKNIRKVFGLPENG